MGNFEVFSGGGGVSGAGVRGCQGAVDSWWNGDFDNFEAREGGGCGSLFLVAGRFLGCSRVQAVGVGEGSMRGKHPS